MFMILIMIKPNFLSAECHNTFKTYCKNLDNKNISQLKSIDFSKRLQKENLHYNTVWHISLRYLYEKIVIEEKCAPKITQLLSPPLSTAKSVHDTDLVLRGPKRNRTVRKF